MWKRSKNGLRAWIWKNKTEKGRAEAFPLFSIRNFLRYETHKATAASNNLCIIGVSELLRKKREKNGAIGTEMISVCMATYNGEAYIEKQLCSILFQTCKADEVILCDDGSTDQTVLLMQRFIEKFDLKDEWKLVQNPGKKGYPGNFYYAMSLCRGDYVFLADQDDIWDERKLEHMSRALEEHPDAAVVSCKFGLIDAQGEILHTMLLPVRSKESGKLTKVSLKDVFYKYQWPGMTLVYRNDWYRNRIAQQKGWNKAAEEQADACACTLPHDFHLCAKAAEEGRLLQLDEILAWHRRHEKNTGKEEHHVSTLLRRERKLQEIREYLKNLWELENGGILETEEGKRTLEDKKASMLLREEALEKKSIGKVLQYAMKYHNYARPATIVCDLLILLLKRV